MKPKNNQQLLCESIENLQKERDYHKSLMERQWQVTVDGLKPSAILNGVVADITKSTRSNSGSLPKLILGIAGGYLSKKIVIGKSNSGLKKIIGYLMQKKVAKYILNSITSSK